MSKKTLLAAILITAIITAAIAYGANYLLTEVLNSGTYKKKEYGVTLSPSALTWPGMTDGEPVTQTVNITNSGTIPITNMTAEEGDAIGLINYTLGWTGEGESLAVGQSLLVNFTLTIYDALDGSFSFKIWISEST